MPNLEGYVTLLSKQDLTALILPIAEKLTYDKGTL